jgi:hypothetical protein
MLESIIYGKDGSAWLNSLRRYVRSGILVPSEQNLVAAMPAGALANPSISKPIVFNGPEDATSLAYSLVGTQGAVHLGFGTISSDGAGNVTGVGTLFTQELIVGAVLIGAAGQATVATITSDTTLTVAGDPTFAAGSDYAFTYPISADVRDRMCVEITDNAFTRRLMNRPIPVVHVFGTPQKPGFLDETIILQGNQSLTMRFYNHSAALYGSFAPTVEIAKFGTEAENNVQIHKLIRKQWARKRFIQPYFLTLDNGYIQAAASSKASGFMTVTGEIRLFLFKLFGHAITTGSTGNIQEKVRIKLWSMRTQRPLMNTWVTLNGLCGTAQNPYVLPNPLIVEPQDQIRVEVENLVTNGTTDLYLTFGGVATYASRWNDRGSLLEAGAVKMAGQLAMETSRVMAIPAGQ